jgi:branched-chain amino acid transport system ATP-binding protein
MGSPSATTGDRDTGRIGPVTGALRCEDVKVHFGGVKAVDGVSFTVAPGSLCGLVGPNGSGKTTLLNAVSGLVPLTAGWVTAHGETLTGRTVPQIARQGVRRTFQTIRLLPTLTVLENVALGADDGRRLLDGLLRPRRAARADRESRQRAGEALARVGLADVGDRLPGELPYGHQRRVEIARALAARPRVLLLDEPVAGMSAEERREIGELLLNLKDEGLTQLLVEHDLEMITRITDHLVVVDFGRVIADGDPDDMVRNEDVREAYLGRRREVTGPGPAGPVRAADRR